MSRRRLAHGPGGGGRGLKGWEYRGGRGESPAAVPLRLVVLVDRLLALVHDVVRHGGGIVEDPRCVEAYRKTVKAFCAQQFTLLSSSCFFNHTHFKLSVANQSGDAEAAV